MKAKHGKSVKAQVTPKHAKSVQRSRHLKRPSKSATLLLFSVMLLGLLGLQLMIPAFGQLQPTNNCGNGQTGTATASHPVSAPITTDDSDTTAFNQFLISPDWQNK